MQAKIRENTEIKESRSVIYPISPEDSVVNDGAEICSNSYER
jgi:hypothetical protein